MTLAALLLAVKALFFFADNGYPDFNRVDESGSVIPPTCDPGAGCVYARYLADGRGPGFETIGVTDTATFTSYYWSQQLATAVTLVALTTGGALIGGLAYGATRPKARSDVAASADSRPTSVSNH